MIEVILYSRTDCHLCEQVRQDLETLQSDYPHRLTIIDVDRTPELQRAYGLNVPVVEIQPYTLKAPITREELKMTLGAAIDRENHIEAVQLAREQSASGYKVIWTKADSFSDWLSRHYLALFNLFVVFYLGLPVLAPILMKSGVTGPAGAIYRVYSMACHQLAYRSFFLFGEQPFYPRAAADVSGLLTFNQATGLSENDTTDALFAARRFIGNDLVGYKIALCERDLAIYAAILLFGLIYAASGRRLPALPWYLWILLGLVPIGVDGVSQLLSQPPFNFLVYRESTPYMRVLTGALFGFMTAWFGYPMVEVTMAETRQIMAQKKLKVSNALASIAHMPAQK
jgi:uncharacterized membrane protein